MTAQEVALRLLEELFGQPPGGAERTQVEAVGGSVVTLEEFQAEGAARVREILRLRGGAVLSDSVGLGKTYIGLALIEEALRAGGDAVVVAPASIRGLWRRALRRLPDAGGGWRLVSHARLARGVLVPPPAEGALHGSDGRRRLVVVDEAHRFRNPRTLRYAALARLVAEGADVLLITATPVNNAPSDLLHLLRLFCPDDGFRDVGVPSLRDAFGSSSPEASPAGAEAARVAAVIRAVVVRRTRAMIHDRFGSPAESLSGGAGGGRPRFPNRAPPRVVRYPDPELPRLVGRVGALELRVYGQQPVRPHAGSGATALIRLNLLKRLDSSPAAFRASLARLEQLLAYTLEAALAGRVLMPRVGAVGGGDDADPLQLTLIELVADPAAPDVDLAELAGSVERDLARVGELVRLRPAAPGGLKELALVDLLERTRGEQTLVFTEYRDTAESLWRALSGRFRTGRVDGGGAWLGSRPAGRRVVVDRFAPRANGRKPPPERERVDVLVATDVLAEGLNLQDARHVVSYDLPWNPVRLLQRIGRVDRLGSPHREIVPYLFAPDEGVEAILGLTRRLRTKLGHIAATVGAEQTDELLERLGRRGHAGSFGALEDPRESDDPIERLRTIWVRSRHHPRQAGSRRTGDHDAAGGRTIRPRARAPARGVQSATAAIRIPAHHPAAQLAWVVLVDCAGCRSLLEIGSGGHVREAGVAAAECLAYALSASPAVASAEEPSHTPGTASAGGIPLGAIRHHLAGASALAHAPPPLRRHDPAHRLARRVRAAMAREGCGLAPDMVTRADHLLARLNSPLGPVAETRARAFLDQSDEDRLAPLMEAVEAMLERAPPPMGAAGGPTTTGGPTQETEAIRIVAALRIYALGVRSPQ